MSFDANLEKRKLFSAGLGRFYLRKGKKGEEEEQKAGGKHPFTGTKTNYFQSHPKK
jgi:hypothetical protein